MSNAPNIVLVERVLTYLWKNKDNPPRMVSEIVENCDGHAHYNPIKQVLRFLERWGFVKTTPYGNGWKYYYALTLTPKDIKIEGKVNKFKGLDEIEAVDESLGIELEDKDE